MRISGRHGIFSGRQGSLMTGKRAGLFNGTEGILAGSYEGGTPDANLLKHMTWGDGTGVTWGDGTQADWSASS